MSQLRIYIDFFIVC